MSNFILIFITFTYVCGERTEKDKTKSLINIKAEDEDSTNDLSSLHMRTSDEIRRAMSRPSFDPHRLLKSFQLKQQKMNSTKLISRFRKPLVHFAGTSFAPKHHTSATPAPLLQASPPPHFQRHSQRFEPGHRYPRPFAEDYEDYHDGPHFAPPPPWKPAFNPPPHMMQAPPLQRREHAHFPQRFTSEQMALLDADLIRLTPAAVDSSFGQHHYYSTNFDRKQFPNGEQRHDPNFMQRHDYSHFPPRHDQNFSPRRCNQYHHSY